MELRKQIEIYQPFNEQEAADQAELLRWMDTGLDLYTRDNGMAHWTASAWVTDQSHSRILMCWHNIYHSWSWLGGHADGERDLASVALREVREESGLHQLKLLSDDIFSLEILTVDGHVKRRKYVPSHLHLNVTYLIEADGQEALHHKDDENKAVAWFDQKEAVDKSSEPWFREHIYTKLNEKMNLFFGENDETVHTFAE